MTGSSARRSCSIGICTRCWGFAEPPEGTNWTLGTDWLSDRGFGLGTEFRYLRNDIFGIPGPTRGFIDAWGIQEQGLDNLGADRLTLYPEADTRGRIRAQHRQMLPDGFQFTAELGLVSDRNFLEQYFEYEWDELKDQTTGIDLKRYVGNSSWDIMGDVRLNDFFTQTEWLPRFDHFLLGESLLQDRLTWFSHSSVGYGHLQIASPPDPINPEEVATFNLLPWEVDSEGVRAPHTSGNRPAFQSRGGQGCAVRVGRDRVLGRDHRSGRSHASLRPSRRAGVTAVLASGPDRTKHALQPERPGSQGDAGCRFLLGGRQSEL